VSKDSSEQYRPLSRGEVIAKRFEVERYLGESLLGPTYAVRNIGNKKIVAIKFIRSEYVPVADIEKIRELMKKANSVEHPNVVRYGKVGEFGGMLFFTQEYFPGENLRDRMLQKEAMPESFSMKEVTEISTEVLSALQAIHDVGIFHTNLSPRNILLRYKTSDRGAKMSTDIKITDIMVVSILGDDKIQESPYRAPECWRGSLEYRGSASDIYSMGNIIYEMLTFQPATGTYLHPTQVRDDLNEHIDTIIDIALAANPSDRYKSADAMRENIMTYFSDVFQDSSAPPEVNQGMMNLIKLSVAFLLVIAVAIFYRGEEEVSTINVRQADKTLRAGIMMEAKSKLPSEEVQRSRQEMYPDMLYVPNGPVLIGALRQEFEYNITGTQQTLAADGEFVAKPRTLNGFFVDRFEWPNRLVDETGAPQEPLVKVTHDVAVNACNSVGKRLCTASEWEKACKGFENYIYSYGDSIDEEICNYKSYSIGVDEECKSSYGVYGMSAGPREWTLTDAGSGTRFVTKGGSLRGHQERSYRCAFTGDDNKSYTDINLSFRCCRSIPQEKAADPAPKTP